VDIVIFSPSEGTNTVPMIHHHDLMLTLEHLAVSPQNFPSFFIPAVDHSIGTLER
jgi:hypothetical protein